MKFNVCSECEGGLFSLKYYPTEEDNYILDVTVGGLSIW